MSTSGAYDLDKLKADLRERGWLPTDLAKAAGLSDMTVSRFLSGARQNSRTALRLCEALGYKTTRRYLITGRAIESASNLLFSAITGRPTIDASKVKR